MYGISALQVRQGRATLSCMKFSHGVWTMREGVSPVPVVRVHEHVFENGELLLRCALPLLLLPQAHTVGALGLVRGIRPKYSEATIRGNIVPPRCFIDMFLLLLLRDLHSFTAPREILFGENIAENDC